MLTAQEHFALIRPILQKSGLPEHWEELTDYLRPALLCEEFRQEYLFHVESSLERWDDEVRETEWSFWEGEGSEEEFLMDEFFMPLGRVLRVKAPGQKKSIQGELSKRGHLLQTYKGVLIGGAKKHVSFLVKSYCEALGEVEFIHLELSPELNRRPIRGGVTPQEVASVLGWVFEQYKDTLKHVGLNFSQNAVGPSYLEATWGTLISCAPSLKGLESLSMGVASDGEVDWGRQVLQSAHFDRLTTLAECSAFYRIPQDALTQREASKNLRRLRLHGIDQATGLALLREPNLANVEVWELLSKMPRTFFTYGKKTYGWGSKFADHWAYERARMRGGIVNGNHPLLLEQSPKLRGMQASEIEAIFTGDDGNLVPSSMVASLSFEDERPFGTQGMSPKHSFVLKLFEQGAVAYPNLKSVSVDWCLTPEGVQQISRSPLLPRLDRCVFNVRYFNGFTTIEENQDHGRAWVELAQDEGLDLRLRQYAWSCFMQGHLTRKNMRLRAEILGLKARKSMKLDALIDVVQGAMPKGIAP